MSPGAVAALRLAASVRPGRTADGYGRLITARLRRLAGTGRTGALPFAGHTEGALYFSDGRVVFAESAGTPGPVIGALPDGAADPAVPAAWAVPAALAAAEPVDGSTARALAWELRRSVFGMTIDVYRLMALRMLSAVDYPVVPGMRALREPPGLGVRPMSFLRAEESGVR
jgi:hypothetical protein